MAEQQLYKQGTAWVGWAQGDNNVTVGRDDGQTVTVPRDFLNDAVQIIANQDSAAQYRRMSVAQVPYNVLGQGIGARLTGAQQLFSGPGESPESSPTTTPSSE